MLYVWYNDGNSTQWVVADNIAGAYLPIGGGTLTGALTLAADAAQPLQPVSLEQMQAYAPVKVAGGFLNRLRNGTFDVWQRGAGPISCPVGVFTYTADGWMVASTGAAASVQQSSPSVSGHAYNQLGILGVASNTLVQIDQRIESNIAMQLGANVPLTFQIKFYNSTGATLTPTFQVWHANTRDNWAGATVDVSSVNLQSCPNSQWTQLAYTFTLPAASLQMGIAVEIDVANVLAGQSIFLSEADLRATPSLPVGLTAAAQIPPPELRPTAIELAFCQRYYETHNGDLMSMNLTGCTNQPFYKHTTFKATKRAVPTMTFVNAGASGFASAAPTLNTVNADGVTWTINAASALINAYITSNWTASAEL
jgi:hypothetical protein